MAVNIKQNEMQDRARALMISCLPGSRNCHGPRMEVPGGSTLACKARLRHGARAPGTCEPFINSLANGGINLYLDQLGQFQSLN